MKPQEKQLLCSGVWKQFSVQGQILSLIQWKALALFSSLLLSSTGLDFHRIPIYNTTEVPKSCQSRTQSLPEALTFPFSWPLVTENICWKLLSHSRTVKGNCAAQKLLRNMK